MTNEALCLAYQAGDRQAAETYSPGMNATFLTYARRIIHNAIRDILRKALSHAEATRRYHLTKRRAKKLEASALHNIKAGYMPNTADWR